MTGTVVAVLAVVCCCSRQERREHKQANFSGKMLNWSWSQDEIQHGNNGVALACVCLASTTRDIYSLFRMTRRKLVEHFFETYFESPRKITWSLPLPHQLSELEETFWNMGTLASGEARRNHEQTQNHEPLKERQVRHDKKWEEFSTSLITR